MGEQNEEDRRKEENELAEHLMPDSIREMSSILDNSAPRKFCLMPVFTAKQEVVCPLCRELEIKVVAGQRASQVIFKSKLVFKSLFGINVSSAVQHGYF